MEFSRLNSTCAVSVEERGLCIEGRCSKVVLAVILVKVAGAAQLVCSQCRAVSAGRL